MPRNPVGTRRPSPQQIEQAHRRLGVVGRGPGQGVTGWLPDPPPAEAPDDFADAEHDRPVGPAGDAGASPGVLLRQWLAGRLPATVRGGLVDPGRRGLVVLACVAVLATGVGVWYFVQARPQVTSAASAADTDQFGVTSSGAVAATVLPTSWPTTARPSPESAASPTGVLVDVVGKVARPGVVSVPASGRIADAIAAAGGALPGTDLTALDLASKVADGEEIFVGIAPPAVTAALGGVVGGVAGGVAGGQPATTAGAGGAQGASSADPVDLNTATEAQLETLPGVGEVLAQRILAWRTQHGGFSSVEQLQQVSGIGPSKYAALAGLVRT